jgi:hypothetical protein
MADDRIDAFCGKGDVMMRLFGNVSTVIIIISNAAPPRGIGV